MLGLDVLDFFEVSEGKCPQKIILRSTLGANDDDDGGGDDKGGVVIIFMKIVVVVVVNFF